ncbi:MAG TPA: hypothetical protein VJB34_00425 [Bdellovibrionota bacterium]|nr:hypothetical protein [Bdellovibrionota bacterium]
MAKKRANKGERRRKIEEKKLEVFVKTGIGSPPKLAVKQQGGDDTDTETAAVELENNDDLSKVETLYTNAFNSPDMNDIPEKTMRKLIRKHSNKPIHYRLVCISLYNKDIVRLEQLLRYSRRLGYSKANKSQIIRFALSKVNVAEMPQMY